MGKENINTEPNERAEEYTDKESTILNQEEENIASGEIEGTEAEDASRQAEEAQPEVDEATALKAELEEAKDKYLRLYSEFENFRRRNAKERLELIKTANEELVTALLPVLDDFERATKAMGEDVKAVKEGVELIYNKLNKSLEQKGLKPMGDLKGKDFDADLHEAITHTPAPEESLKGKIVDVIENGYYLNDKVIRYAKVIIGA